MINLSKAAANEIRRLQATRQKLDSQLRLKVEAGGCSGLFYLLEFDETPPVKEIVCNSNGISIVVDAESYKFLEGLNIDYSEDLMGGGFRFHNPNATNTCSCGNSFAKKN
ncbi:HesB/IscA family protein [Oscillatoria salina]|uniref:HesB/IscA family protein n=1 Tax=Oscillatoria salina TaxID=331517 RepID=UPI0013BC4668|nr:iron-sulfur cluster assembly accessory protein [Oscillatoria salina]MBZ8178833.1 iron-sulfur cluster assembly accessory protein [Oscillatoria salina IIICB1]NET90288.1 iron-sulfur cluster assembly accessory protein [Kamptonema sp. SIO1D9]